MQKDDRVSILSIRRIWIDLALTVFSIQVIVFAVLVIRHEAAKGNGPMETAQVVVVQLVLRWQLLRAPHLFYFKE